MKILYFTHCSDKKDDRLKGTNQKVTPDKLYTATYLQRFIKRCRISNVDWAIFSDEYGFVFPYNEISWYNKSPKDVTPIERQKLFDEAFNTLKSKSYDHVIFYYNPGRFSPLYRQLIGDMEKKGIEIKEITHLDDIS
jgi:C-terminal processing protease CtpA/Prc